LQIVLVFPGTRNLSEAAAEVSKALFGDIHGLVLYLWPYVAVLAGFVAFVLWNDGAYFFICVTALNRIVNVPIPSFSKPLSFFVVNIDANGTSRHLGCRKII
jgi:hypothetical protein